MRNSVIFVLFIYYYYCYSYFELAFYFFSFYLIFIFCFIFITINKKVFLIFVILILRRRKNTEATAGVNFYLSLSLQKPIIWLQNTWNIVYNSYGLLLWTFYVFLLSILELDSCSPHPYPLYGREESKHSHKLLLCAPQKKEIWFEQTWRWEYYYW